MIKKAELYNLITNMNNKINILEGLVDLHESISKVRDGTRELIFFPAIPFIIPWNINKYDEDNE